MARTRKTGSQSDLKKTEGAEKESQPDAPPPLETGDKGSEDIQAPDGAHESSPLEETATLADVSETAALEEASAPAAGDSEPREEHEPPEPAVRSQGSGGFVPLLLGGIVAGGIGFAAATYLAPVLMGADDSEEIQALTNQLAQQKEQVSTLRAEVVNVEQGLAGQDGLRDRADALGEELGSLRQEIEGRLDTLDQAVGAMDDRVTELEKRPVADGSASATALEAFGREMDAMRAEFEEARSDITSAATDATDRMASIAAEAESLREAADETARAAAARAALGRLRTAVETGGELTAAINALKDAGIEVPAKLEELLPSVPSAQELDAAFPPAARNALSVSLKETAGDSAWDRIGAFMRSQTGARSLIPREGNDPDAVLSRAEAALDSGNIPQAIDEIANLPEAGQEQMANWVTEARRRQEALEALAELTTAME